MKRALILIITLSALSFGLGWRLDSLQRRTAETYLDRLQDIRRMIVGNDLPSAAGAQQELCDQWQRDSHWLNLLVDHHHTREVECAFRHLATSLQADSRVFSLLAADELIDALEEVAQREVAMIENIM